MRIDYAVSLWNYWWYAHVPSLERVVARIRDEGFGAEFHIHWNEEKNLYDETGRERLRPLAQGIPVSLHGSGGMTTELERRQLVDTAGYIGARVVVVHPNELGGWKPEEIDEGLVRDFVDYADKRSVAVALENGGLEVLVSAMDKEPRLGICIDVGHIYLGSGTMKEYLDVLKGRLVHLHLQDIMTPVEEGTPGAIRDHYTPGTGAIPIEDWRLLMNTLEEIDFEGMAVHEIHPRDPIQHARLATTFMKGLSG